MLVRVKKGRDASFFVDKQVQGDGIFLHMVVISGQCYTFLKSQNLLIFLKYFSNHTYIIINTGFCLFADFVFKAGFGLEQRSQEGCLGSPRGG